MKHVAIILCKVLVIHGGIAVERLIFYLSEMEILVIYLV